MDRTCARCSSPLPEGSQTNRVYCSKACGFAAFRERDPAARKAANKAWREATRESRRAKLLEARPLRHCAECGASLPRAAGNRRRFCDRRCTNQFALRERYEQRLEANRRRRARIAAAGGPGVRDRDWQRLVRRHGNRCAYCQRRGRLTMDHVVPIARGGRHSIGNVLPACFPCNSSKRDDFLAHWRRGIPAARLRRP